MSRRVSRGASIVTSSVLSRGAQDGADDPVVGAAAAEMVGERCPHVRLLGLRIAVEQVGRRHDHAARAIAH